MSAWIPERPEGETILDELEHFLARFVIYPTIDARVAHTLWIAHAWFMDAWENTPRIAFLSPEPGSGKSRALEVSAPLVPRAVHAVNTTPAYLFRKVSDPDGLPTILYDEIDTVFGPKAKDNEDIRGMLNAGHHRSGMAGRCVVRGRVVETEELPAYCAVALAGLDDLPDTLMSRAVVVRMRRRAPSETVEPWRMRINGPEGEDLAADILAWSSGRAHLITWPDLPVEIQDRDADIWEPLIAVADLAGGAWPERARRSGVALVAEKSDRPPSLGVMLLQDLRDIFRTAGNEKMSPDDLLEQLIEMDESPWADIRGKALNARSLANRLSKYGVRSKNVRVADRVIKGYDASDLADAWTRYLPDVTDQVTHSSKRKEEVENAVAGPSPDSSATSATPLPTYCQQCGNRLLIDIPGRDLCEACRIRQERAS